MENDSDDAALLFALSSHPRQTSSTPRPPRYSSPIANVQRTLRFDPIGSRTTPRRDTPAARSSQGLSVAEGESPATTRQPPPEAATPTRSSRSAARDGTPGRARSSTPTRPRNPSPARSSAPKKGRPEDKIWQHFERNPTDRRHASCMYCSKSVNNAKPGGNMLQHIKKCPKLPVRVLMEYCTRPKPNDTTPPKRPTKALPPSYDQALFQLKLATMFYVCSLPFALVDAPVFKDFVAMVAPGMTVPTRKQLGSTLLESVLVNIRREVVALINSRNFVSLVTDCWTDPNGANIINFMVMTPTMPPMFWSSWSTKSAQHTADHLANEIEKVITSIHKETTARVVGIMTDNASNMLNASADVEGRVDTVVGGGCSAHWLNRLMQDVCRLPEVEEVRKRAVAIARFIKDHLALLDEFKSILEKGRKEGNPAQGLVMPMPTRWYTVHSCLRNVSRNRDAIEKLFMHHDYDELRSRYVATPQARVKFDYVQAVVMDSHFWENLRCVVRLTEPISVAIGVLESNKSFVSSVYECFCALYLDKIYRTTLSPPDQEIDTARLCEPVTARPCDVGVENDDVPTDEDSLPPPGSTIRYQPLRRIDLMTLEASFRAKILKRWKYVHVNAMGVAFYLDPTKKLSKFVKGDEDKARDQALEFALKNKLVTGNKLEGLQSELYDYAAQKKNEKHMASTCPVSYWDRKRAVFPMLGKIADIVFALPTSSAASERAWSIFDHIHSKKRNRLSVAKIEKLAYIYINYGNLKNEKVDLARHQARPDCVEEEENAVMSHSAVA